PPSPLPLPLPAALPIFYGVGFFLGRARSRMPDVPRPWPFIAFIDEPYFVHWCASLFASIASLLIIISSPVVDVVRGRDISFPTRSEEHTSELQSLTNLV